MDSELIGLIKKARKSFSPGLAGTFLWIACMTLALALCVSLVGLIGGLVIWLAWRCVWMLIALCWLGGKIIFAYTE